MIRAKQFVGVCLAAMLLLSTGAYAEDEATTEITAVEPASESESATEELPKVGDDYSSITILDGVANNGDMPQFTDNLDQSTITATGSNENQYFPFKIANVEEGGQMLVAKSYEVPADVNANDLIESNVTRENVKYKARDILQKKIKGEEVTKTMRKPVTISSESKEKAKIMALLQPTIEYDEGGYHGTLTLETESVTTETAGTSTYSYELTDTKEYTGLERNDPSLVSKTITKNGVTLNMSNIEWLPMGSTVSGETVVQSYKAVVTYGGTTTGSKVSSYAVTAQYSGEVIKKGIGSCIYTIVYEPVKDVPVKAAPIKLPELSGQTWLVIFGSLVGLAIIILLVILIKNKKYKAPRHAYAPSERELHLTENKAREKAEKTFENEFDDEFKKRSCGGGGLLRPSKKTGRCTAKRPRATEQDFDDSDELISEEFVSEERYSGLLTEDDYDEAPVYASNCDRTVIEESYDGGITCAEQLKESLNWVSREGFTVHDGEQNAKAALDLLNRMSSEADEPTTEPTEAQPEPEFAEPVNISLNPAAQDTDEDDSDEEELVLPEPVFEDEEPEFADTEATEEDVTEDIEVYLPANDNLPTLAIDDDPALIEALQLNEEN